MQFLRNFLKQTVQFRDYMNKEQSYWQCFYRKIRSFQEFQELNLQLYNNSIKETLEENYLFAKLNF